MQLYQTLIHSMVKIDIGTLPTMRHHATTEFPKVLANWKTGVVTSNDKIAITREKVLATWKKNAIILVS